MHRDDSFFKHGPACLFALALILTSGCANHETVQNNPVSTNPRADRYESTGAPTRVSGPPTSPVSYTSNPGRASSTAPWPSDAPPTIAESAIMVDARSGKVLYKKNPDERRAVASTQKLLTALVILDAGNLDKELVVHPEAAREQPSKLYLKSGETYTRRELLRLIMIKSANDAATALAIDHSGSEQAFAYAMTRKARSLGANNSFFVNAHGLTESGQYSTARDMATVAMAAYRQPLLRRWMDTGRTTFIYDDGRRKSFKNTNHLVREPNHYNGMKTGFTNASGRCLISSVSEGMQDIILVQLGGTRKFVFDDAARLLQWQLNRSPWSSLARR